MLCVGIDSILDGYLVGDDGDYSPDNVKLYNNSEKISSYRRPELDIPEEEEKDEEKDEEKEVSVEEEKVCCGVYTQPT